MELSCTENMPTTANFAQKDPAIFGDMRVIENLLTTERLYIPSVNYFDEVQHDVKPFMRNIVATWMMEVCEEQMCEEPVFSVACNYMDRFLCVCPIKRNQLQLLAATCLLIASKIRSSTVLGIDLLCAYTDYSVAHEHIANWELLVMSKLQWNASSITGFDYVDHLTERFPWGNESHYLRRHAHTLVSICYVESSLIQTSPSLIAAACISSAMQGLQMPSTELAKFDMCNLLQIDPNQIEELKSKIDGIIEREFVKQIEKTNVSPNLNSCSTNGFESPSYRQPETPTEVENVHF